VPRLLPAMPTEPPDGYVDFVARHLDALRRDAARVVGDERDAHQLYPDVLTDVAVRWRWLDLLHTRLRRPEAGERYLRQAFARRSQRWRSEQMFPVDIQVWRPDEPARAAPPGWSSATFGPAAPEGQIQVRAMAAAPAWSSAALRLAAHVTPGPRVEIRPIAEAAVAWWHAYEAHRRRRLFTALGVLFLFVMLITRLQEVSS
jgi:hypothetical protein